MKRREISSIPWTGFGVALLLIILSGWPPSPAAAHPLDEFYQVTFAAVAPNRIDLTVELYTGVLVAPQLIALIDTDGDEQFSAAEQAAYVALFSQDVTFTVDERPTSLAPTRLEFPSLLDLRGGVGVIRFILRADLPPSHRGAHQFFYQNNHQPIKNSLYLANAVSDAPRWVQITQQERDVFQQSLSLAYTIDPAAPAIETAQEETAQSPPVELPPGAATAGSERLTGYLYDPELSPWWALVVIGVSVALGGLHALTPGHGKTLVAAYLIGSRGTIRHAVFLGGVVTFTHTASVVIIGLLALLASQFIVPDLFAPALEVASGLLVVYLGGQLLWSRWRAYRQKQPALAPAALEEQLPAPHHGHAHEHHHHHHHHHHLPDQVRLGELLTLGISGGLVPCPEALGIMLIAIGLNRILLGLGMVVAFSFGLAAVLIVIGVLLVRAKSLLARWGQTGQRWQLALPLVSAVLVTLLGVGIVLKGLWAYL